MHTVAAVPITTGTDLPNGWTWWTTSNRAITLEAIRICDPVPPWDTNHDNIDTGEKMLTATTTINATLWTTTQDVTRYLHLWWDRDTPRPDTIRAHYHHHSTTITIWGLPTTTPTTSLTGTWTWSTYPVMAPPHSTTHHELPITINPLRVTWDPRQWHWDPDHRDWIRRHTPSPQRRPTDPPQPHDPRIARADPGTPIPTGWVPCQYTPPPATIPPWTHVNATAPAWWSDWLAWTAPLHIRRSDAEYWWTRLMPSPENTITTTRTSYPGVARRGLNTYTEPTPITAPTQDAAIAAAIAPIQHDRNTNKWAMPPTGWPPIWVVHQPENMSRDGAAERSYLRCIANQPDIDANTTTINGTPIFIERREP